jgi:hypothetical protein
LSDVVVLGDVGRVATVIKDRIVAAKLIRYGTTHSSVRVTQSVDPSGHFQGDAVSVEKGSQSKCTQGTSGVLEKEQLKNVGRPEVHVAYTEFEEREETHDCKRRRREQLEYARLSVGLHHPLQAVDPL